ncbi:MAG: hypothetical protein K2L72_03755 [Clostridia bacterium]|nr:hypothetical protein [Clostridia bacterium]
MKISEDLIKNDVPATGQLKDNDCVSFNLTENADIKIAFLGNSITRHGKAENLGWYGDWGMAASCRENDYVHRVVAKLEQSGKRVSYCVANLSEWERTLNAGLLEERYSSVRAFNPQIVVVRLGENARVAERLEEFKPRYGEMVEYFASCGAKVVLTDLFWEYGPFDAFVKQLAENCGYAFVQIHDLGHSDEMKATGKFEHGGVAAHPGDRGMAEIAQRIYRALKIN